MRVYGEFMGEPLRVIYWVDHHRRASKLFTVVFVAVAATVMLAAENPAGSAAAPAAGPVLSDSRASFAAVDVGPQIAAAASDVLPAYAAPTSAPTAPPLAGPTFRTINVSKPGPPAKGEWVDPNRPMPAQPSDWTALKAAGRIAIVGGKIVVLPSGTNPMSDPVTGLALPTVKTLDVSWTRWVVEPPGAGRDEKGTYYNDLSYWKLCGDGAMTVALWYWQQLTGYPNVTGTAGYFVDPYVAQGSYWPRPGPRVALSGKTRLGTYWSGVDNVDSYPAHGRGFMMYLAMAAQPATWKSPGFAVFTQRSQPLYPTYGTDRDNTQAGLNWEVSGHDPSNWATAYYTSANRSDSNLGRDLKSAVMLDVGRDGIPVEVQLDTYYLPNWQSATEGTPHMSHAVSIVGYDNVTGTYTYVDTCGHQCNQRNSNKTGDIHVIAQTQMAQAMQNRVESGFTW